jgi:hypothetical protein
MPHQVRRLAARLLASAALLAAASGAVAAELSQPQVTLEGHQVLLSFQLDGAFDDALVARLDSGLPTAFVYEVELHRDRKHWWDDKRRAATLEVVAMYNAVAQEYLVNFKHDGRLVESRLARSREELIAAMTRIDRVPLLHLGDLESGTRLLVKARAQLGSRTILAFIPVDVETDWVTSKKFRVP